jgi:hypothetical protein
LVKNFYWHSRPKSPHPQSLLRFKITGRTEPFFRSLNIDNPPQVRTLPVSLQPLARELEQLPLLIVPINRVF